MDDADTSVLQGNSGFSDSHGAVVIPDAGTIYLGDYHMTGEWDAIDANKGVLVSTHGRLRRLSAPVRRDDTTTSGDGWTFIVKPGWVIREGPRRGDDEVVRQQP